jgi:hypothetical protein
MAQSGREGRGLPVAVRYHGFDPLTAWCPAPQRLLVLVQVSSMNTSPVGSIRSRYLATAPADGRHRGGPAWRQSARFFVTALLSIAELPHRAAIDLKTTLTSRKSPRQWRQEPTPSFSSIKPDGICRQDWRFPPISPLSRCRRNALNSIQSKISGSTCATTGSRTASSNPTTILSITAAMPGTCSSNALGKSCPSDYANGHMGSDQ